MKFSSINYFVFRFVMGINMFIHGAVRIFGDYNGFIHKMETSFSETLLPKLVVTIAANIISPLELLFGFLLLIGYKTRLSIIVLNANMLLLVSGVCLLQKWNLAGLQMGYVLYLFFLGQNIKLNKVSIDSFKERRAL